MSSRSSSVGMAPGQSGTSRGGSWKPVLLGSTGKVQRPIDRFVFHQAVEVDHPQSAVRKGDFKLLYYWDTREAMLFDLAKDPAEANDLARAQPERIVPMQTLWDVWNQGNRPAAWGGRGGGRR